MGHTSNHRKTLILMLSILLSAIVLLGYDKYKDAITFKESPEWSNELVLTFNGHEYNVIEQTTKDVGDKIGTIAYHGKSGNAYSLYAIKNSKNNDRIALKTKKGFLIAIIIS